MGLSLSMLVNIAVSSAPVGMYDSINSNSVVKNFIRKTVNLAFLPDDDVVAGWTLVSTLYPQELDCFAGYFEPNWIGRVVDGTRREPRFKISSWTQRNRVEAGLMKSNNSIEGFHH